jgi:nucleotide-binding universal stress UspA family protein
VRRILCATDFSDAAAPAERLAVTLAQPLGAEVVLIHVASESPLWRETVGTPDVRAVFEAQRHWATDTLTKRVEAMNRDGARARWLLRVGVAWEEVVRAAAEEDADMIVMGTHGRTGLDRLLLGSVAERVVRRAPCPVLTVQPDHGGLAKEEESRDSR